MPAADYILYGNVNIEGGSFRYYDNSRTHRLNLSGFTGKFRDLTLNNAPITVGLYGIPTNKWAAPAFDNVYLFYQGKILQPIYDTLIHDAVYTRSLTINRNDWTATMTGAGLDKIVQVGDYILGSPTSTSRKYWDSELTPESCNTIQIGRVTGLTKDTLFLDDVGVNAYGGVGYDAFYISRVK
jgi:hypothetical protein